MTKVVLPLGSFIVGACCAFIASSLMYTSTRVQAEGQGAGLRLEGVEPVVPGLGPRFRDSEMSGAVQPFDGVNCERCAISTPVITYAGGAFDCTGCVIRFKQVQLKGAALNTFNALRLFGIIPTPRHQDKPQNPTQHAMLTIATPQKPVTWVSLEGIPK